MTERIIVADRLTPGLIIACDISKAEPVIGLEFDKILNPNIKWLGVSWFGTKSSTYILQNVKKLRPDCHIVAGGYSSSLNKEPLLQSGLVDEVVSGYIDDYQHTYNYQKYIINYYDSYMFETTRSCPRALYNRCAYCSQFKVPYIKFDLDTITTTLKQRPEGRALYVIDPEVPPDSINRLWREFHKEIHCFIEPSYIDRLDSTLENCRFYAGGDGLFGDNPFNTKKQFTIEQYIQLKQLAKKNYIILSQVVKDLVIDWDIWIKESLENPNIEYCFNEYIDFQDFEVIIGRKTGFNTHSVFRGIVNLNRSTINYYDYEMSGESIFNKPEIIR